MPYARQLHCLRSHPYFQDLEAPVLEAIAKEMIYRQYTAGETIFLQEDEALGLWLIGNTLI